MKKIYILLLTLTVTSLSFGQVINEVDADTPGTDAAEFLAPLVATISAQSESDKIAVYPKLLLPPPKLTVDGVITEFPNGIPSDEDIATWKAEYDSYISATAYVGKRKDEYPAIEDQLDKIYHEGIDEWKKVIKVVKDKYPKPD